MVRYLSDFEGENQMASKDDRISLTLKCTECGEENYLTSKNKKKHADRLELKKYCPFDRKHTLHKETNAAFIKERAELWDKLFAAQTEKNKSPSKSPRKSKRPSRNCRKIKT